MLRALVDVAKQGDEEAFGAVVRTVGDRCMAIAYRILPDVDLAEDAVQTALISAWRELPTLRDPDRFDPWLHRMLVNACYAEARRSKRWAANLFVLATEGASAPDDLLTVNDRDQLERGIQRLPPDQRAVLVFRHYLGLTLPGSPDGSGLLIQGGDVAKNEVDLWVVNVDGSGARQITTEPSLYKWYAWSPVE